MIEFVTLLQGLLLGAQPVVVWVHPQVAAVELRLDGTSVAHKEGPPWTFEVDFGKEFSPHLLEAVALGSAGEVLDHTRMEVNWGSHSIHLAALVAPGEGWPPMRVRLVSEGPPDAPFPQPEAWQEGRRLAVAANGLLELRPPRTPEAFRLRIRAGNGDHEVTREIVFGGRRPSTDERTLVSLSVPPDIIFEPERSWLTAGGEPARVVKTKPPSPLLAVVWDRNLPPGTMGEVVSKGEEGHGPSETGIRVWRVRPGTHDRFTETSLGPMTRPRRGLLGAFLRLEKEPSEPAAEQMLFDAVAHAGVLTARSGRARAVLLLLDGESMDASAFDLQEVSGFLSSLGVPFCVWIRVLHEDDEVGGDTCFRRELAAAVREMAQVLERQRIVVLEGLHLPQSIALTGAAPEGVRLAGR